jgi:purine nucleoside permease
MFSYEAVWPEALGLTENISIPGLSPLYPNIYCNPEGSICTYVTGEAEINAATTTMVSSEAIS